MKEEENKRNLFSYLDKVMGQDGIKTSNKFDISVDSQTAMTLLGIGVGLVIFSHLLGAGVQLLIGKK
jgi:hypothetical protein